MIKYCLEDINPPIKRGTNEFVYKIIRNFAVADIMQTATKGPFKGSNILLSQPKGSTVFMFREFDKHEAEVTLAKLNEQ